MNNRARIPVSRPFLTDEAKQLVLSCMDDGWISSKGNYVDRFESDFADYLGVRHAISVSSGTAALHVSLLAMGIGPGDEVIVPDLTFAATANAVIQCGAKAVLCAVNLLDWNMDPEDLDRCFSARTKAVIPVHLYGNPARLHEITQWAELNGVPVIEDCAESLGATFNGIPTGRFGRLGCFSFFANKLITTGEGGMVVTDSDETAEKVRCFRDHGMSHTRYWHDLPGLNYRMTNLQAAIGVSQLHVIEYFIKKRRWIEECYRNYLPLLTQEFRFQLVHENSESINWLMSLLIRPEATEANASKLVSWLDQNNVEARPFFYPLHQQPPYMSNSKYFGTSEYIFRKGISLPTFFDLSEPEIEKICSLVASFLESDKKYSGV